MAQYKNRLASNKIKVRLNWEWSNAPINRGTAIYDKIVCGFKGVNNSNGVAIITPDSLSCSVHYHLLDDEEIGMSTFAPTTPDIFGVAEVSIPTSRAFSNQVGWAKSGSFTIGVREEATMNDLYSVSFGFGYGHPVQYLQPSISINFGGSVTGGIGLTVGDRTEKMIGRGVVIGADGSESNFYM